MHPISFSVHQGVFMSSLFSLRERALTAGWLEQEKCKGDL